MSTSSPSPASNAPRQLTLPFPPEFDLDKFYHSSYWASSASHLALLSKYWVFIYSLPAFDLIDTIRPEGLSTCFEYLGIHERFLIVLCGSSSTSLLYIWDLSARKHIGTVKHDEEDIGYLAHTAVCFPSTKNLGGGQGYPSEFIEDLLLITCWNGDLGTTDLKTYVLHPDAESAKGGIERAQEPLPLTPVMTIRSIPKVNCFASMGKTALTGGEDYTVRAWDISSGKCQMVFIGHTDWVFQVVLDEERVYSSSGDHTIRVWDRYRGDCLHVLEIPTPYFSVVDFFVQASPYLILVTDFNVFTWDIRSGKLLYRLNGKPMPNRHPIRGDKHTLATIEFGRDRGVYWFRTWDLRSGRSLTSSSFEPGPLYGETFLQGRFFVGGAYEYGNCFLKVWDFGSNDSLDAEVGNNDCRNSREDIVDGIEENDHGKVLAPSTSSSAIEGGSSANPKTTEKRKMSSIQGQNSQVGRAGVEFTATTP